MDVSDAPRVTVDKLYLSHHSQLTLELVCSAQANPTASITWSRMEPDTGAWVELIEDPTETGVWTVDRQVMTWWQINDAIYSNCLIAMKISHVILK